LFVLPENELQGIIIYVPTEKALQADYHHRADNESNHKSRHISENELRGIIITTEKALQTDGHGREANEKNHKSVSF
jgi:hypothetical protein